MDNELPLHPPDSNLYCHPCKELYILAYVDDLLIIGDAQKTKNFVDHVSKELLVKIPGKLEPGTKHLFLGRNCATMVTALIS